MKNLRNNFNIKIKILLVAQNPELQKLLYKIDLLNYHLIKRTFTKSLFRVSSRDVHEILVYEAKFETKRKFVKKN